MQASRHGVFVTPVYLVNELYNRRLGTQKLAVRADGPTFDTSREGKGVPFLDVVVSRAANGKQIFIKAVNTDGKHALRAAVRISGAGVGPEAEMETITGDSLTAANSFASPEAVSTRRSTIRADSRFVVELPPYSVSVITVATTE